MDKTSKEPPAVPVPSVLVVLPAVGLAGSHSGSDLIEKLVDVVRADEVGQLDLSAAHHVDNVVGAGISRGKILEEIPDVILDLVAGPFQYLRDEPSGLVVDLLLLLLGKVVAEPLALLALLLLPGCGHSHT